MGDSYSAGPGAGDSYDNMKYGSNPCFRGTGAYGPKLDALNIDELGNFQFLSCTGHVTDDVVKWQFPDLNWHEVNSRMRVVLSIGGNDLLFSSYIKACLLGVPFTDCTQTKGKIDNLLDNLDGNNTLYKNLANVWSRYNKRDRFGVLPRVTPVWQTGYPRFFRSDTDHCDNERISLGKLFRGPLMKKALRAEVNDYVARANSKIAVHGDTFQNDPENYWSMGGWAFVDYDSDFGDHRLCEDFVTDGVGFSNPDVWFLGVAQSDHDDDNENASVQGEIGSSVTYDQVDPNTCDPDQGDLGLSVACSVAQYKAQNPDADLSTLVLPQWVTKGFHPKSSGFNRARDRVHEAMFGRLPNIRVLPLGDGITDGDGSSDGNGYRQMFYNLAAADERSVDMIGSVKAGDMGDPDNEGHSSATISQISNFADASLERRPNLILLYAGTDDLDSDATAAGAPDRLASLVDKILNACPDAALLVSKVIPSPNAARQARANTFNAAVTSLVNSRKAAGKKIQLMHMDRAIPTNLLTDDVHPNDDGYVEMGWHWYGGLKYADNKGWINDPLPGTSNQLPKLRIQPLGDSITQGNLSPDKNGYRGPLREMLADVSDGVDMIGSRVYGSMADNAHQGHSGQLLDVIKKGSACSIGAQPNLILLHGGTNNMDLNIDVDKSPDLVRQIIDQIFEGAVDATIIVAKIIWANKPEMQKRSDVFNVQIGEIVDDYQSKGKHVLLADMSDIITTADLADLKHPNAQGYKKMADVWYDTILDANERGWLKDPVSPTKTDCTGLGVGVAGSFCSSYCLIDDSAGGGGSGGLDFGCDGGNWAAKDTVFTYPLQAWQDMGEIFPSQTQGARDKVIFADLNGDGADDYILADYGGDIRAWTKNKGVGNAVSLGKINPPWEGVNGSMVRFADVDGDGKADVIVVYSDGAAKVWKNVDGKSFEALDANFATGLEEGKKIHFADMDGDGYADYVILYDGGAVSWARNTHNNGKDQSVKNWETAVSIAPGVSGVSGSHVRIWDFDGDGLADYVIVNDDGSVRVLRNLGNLNKDSSQRNWDDWGIVAPGVSGVSGDAVALADLNGDGWADFLSVDTNGAVHAWYNTNTPVAKGASLRFADLDGDKVDDIIAVTNLGTAYGWLGSKDPSGTYKYLGLIAPGPKAASFESRVIFADINGDGLADYIVIQASGKVEAFLNNGNIPDAGKDRTWADSLVISPGLAGVTGDMIRLSDVSGDGYADFIVIHDDGSAVVYLNNRNIPPEPGTRIWAESTLLATGVGEPSSKIQFADITGDGRAEYLVVYDGGAVRGYNNTGNVPDANLGRIWYDMGTIAAGVSDQGPIVRFADVNGDGKMDYLSIFDDGRIDAYINKCSWKAH
ncbi:hypothetical protein F4777DRAFT_580445 [Nemania sp. FL0916]|nr:hypothetical protein F4777DRAFT_580445 [Nemania sp. FL0916]